jgi:hypothetical protein
MLQLISAGIQVAKILMEEGGEEVEVRKCAEALRQWIAINGKSGI